MPVARPIFPVVGSFRFPQADSKLPSVQTVVAGMYPDTFRHLHPNSPRIPLDVSPYPRRQLDRPPSRLFPADQRRLSVRDSPVKWYPARTLPQMRYALGAMTVCIAASTAIKGVPAVVLCVDMMGSTDYTSSETIHKFYPVGPDFFALLAGTLSDAGEFARLVRSRLSTEKPADQSALLRQIRAAVRDFKHAMAETHIETAIGISYDEFRRKGKKTLPEDLYRSLCWEIRNQQTDVELLIAGFLPVPGKPERLIPAIVKVSFGKVWYSDNFAVAGSGAGIAEPALFHRNQNSLDTFEATVYQVYEAKCLAERSPGVGRRLIMLVLRPKQRPLVLTEPGIKFLDKQVKRFSPRRLKLPDFPDGMFDQV